MDTEGEHRHEQTWRGRRQMFNWVNGIEYEYGSGKRKKGINIHLVTCDESWEEIDKNSCVVIKTVRHAWLSSDPVSRKEVHDTAI